jgi:aminopeptidase N
MVRTRWKTLRPIYTAIMVIGVAPFAVVELGDTACGLGELPGCVRQSVWTTPAQRAFVPGNFARAGEIVALFSRLAGPYPYEKLAHVASSTRYGGMENAAAIFYAGSLFRQGSPSEGLIAHETAHQWFGDAVTVHEWPHVWLSEGFATYFAALWTEHAHGDSAFIADRIAMRSQVLKAKITWDVPVINEQLDDVSRVLNSNVYQKAGFVLHMLRREIGDSAFFNGIRAYYAAHRHGNAMTSDLQAQFERTAGRSLDWFFEQWMRRPGVAELRPSWRWDAVAKQVMVTVAQGSRGAPYRLTLPVDVTDASGRTTRVQLAIPAQSTVTMAVPVALSAAPQRVVFDADAEVLATISSP